MSGAFRIIDTGIREGRANIAFDQAMIDLRRAGAIPDSIRFLGFPPTVLIGRHQALGQEVALDHCRTHGIGIARRITGGGAIYFDEAQLGWSLVFNRATLGIASLDALAREICEAAAAGLRRLGVDARYRPRNDIEVGGRKLSGTGGFFDGDTLFYQGTVLIDMDPADMVAALRIPTAKLGKRGITSIAARIVTLRELLGSATPDPAAIKAALVDGFCERLGISAYSGEVSAAEETAAREIFDDEVGTDEFVHEIDDPGAGSGVRVGTHSGTGGTVTCYLRLDGGTGDRIRDVLLTGDYFVTPPRVVWDLEAALRGVPLGEWRAKLDDYFDATAFEVLSASPADFAAAIAAAIGEPTPADTHAT